MLVKTAALVAGITAATITVAAVLVDQGVITLTPEAGYLGELVEYETCAFSYSAGTELAPGTALQVSPTFSETYGDGSVVAAGDGMYCGSCMVASITMDATGVTQINCEPNR